MIVVVTHSRVVLKNLPSNVPSDVGAGFNEELNYYMNGNYINVTYLFNICKTFVRGQGEKAFIATQAPIEYTLERFWQMIWEHRTSLIIMLCPLQGPKKVFRSQSQCNLGGISSLLGRLGTRYQRIRQSSFPAYISQGVVDNPRCD